MKIFTNRIRHFRGKPVYEVLCKTKESKGKFFICYREYVDGKRFCRNLYFAPIGGYFAKGEPEKGLSPCGLDHTPIWLETTANEDNCKPITDMFPDFMYIIKKSPMLFLHEVFARARLWREFPKMELLLNMGFFNMATNRSFLKLSERKQKEILQYAIDHSKPGERTFLCEKDIRGAMKEKVTPYEFRLYRQDTHNTGITYKQYVHLRKKGISPYDFKFHMERLEKHFPDRLKDDYWTKFKDLNDFHRKERKVQEEVKHILELKDRMERRAKMKAYLKAIKKFKEWHGRFNGLDVYIPTKLDDFEAHADALNQCLVYGDYIGKVARGKCVIVFVKDKDKPLATAELDLIDSKPVLGQFHGNQDLDDISPTPKAQKAMDMFMKKYVSAA